MLFGLVDGQEIGRSDSIRRDFGPEQGTFLCSGALVATRDNSFDPYLLTAGHCVHDESAARSLETFWAYESTACSLGPPANRGTVNSQNGGHLLAWAPIDNGDYSLVLLPNVPTGVVFAGWDRPTRLSDRRYPAFIIRWDRISAFRSAARWRKWTIRGHRLRTGQFVPSGGLHSGRGGARVLRVAAIQRSGSSGRAC